MEYIILVLAGFVVGCFLLLLEAIVFGLNQLIEKCESLKKRLKEKKND